MHEPTLTIREAALATGLSQKAIRRRIERGSLRADLRASRLRIPLDELLARDLLVSDPQAVAARLREDAHLRASAGGLDKAVHAELLERLERQAERIGELTAELRAEREARGRLEAELARVPPPGSA